MTYIANRIDLSCTSQKTLIDRLSSTYYLHTSLMHIAKKNKNKMCAIAECLVVVLVMLDVEMILTPV